MNSKIVRIRQATVQDAKALLEIYAPYVKNTAITFEYEVPSLLEFESRVLQVQKRYPYLVAEIDGEMVGYAYANAFHERAAYDWAVEMSIYVHPNKKKMGIGKKLYDALEKALAAQNILNLNACIAYSAQEDAFLPKDSVLFHQRFGYRLVGEFHQCGYKFHRWYDMIWMEKHLGNHTESPADVVPFDQVEACVKRKCGIV